MSKENSVVDRWLRPAGSWFIALLCLFLVLLSFMMRESLRSSRAGKLSTTASMISSASRMENWFYDLRTSRFYAHQQQSPNIVILDLTDNTLNKIGRWPWSRVTIAKLIDHLRIYGTRVVMFDTLFPEPESEKADQALVDAIERFNGEKGRAVVLAYGITSTKEDGLESFPEVLYGSVLTGTAGREPMAGASFIEKNNFAAPKLTTSSALFGFISFTPDVDGIFRHAQLAYETEKSFLPSLGLAGFVTFHSDGADKKVMLEAMPGTLQYQLRILQAGTERHFLLSSTGELKLRFFGGEPNFLRIPVEEILLDPNPAGNEKLKKLLTGKASLFGSSAFGAHDLRHTPVDSQTPGMYVHANLFHALDQDLKFRQEDESMLLSILIFLLGITTVFWLTRFRDPLYETLGVALVAGGIYATDYFYFAPRGFFLALFFTLVGILGLYAWNTILNVFKEAREKKKIRDTFTRYVAPKIVKEMLSHPEKLKVGGEKKTITMLFSDVRDFTSISERLGPQELATMLNIYMGKMTDILFETNGTLDKYIGDAIIGFWGAPLEVPDHPYHGVRAAKLMLEALPAINDEFEKRKFPRINVGIGLNSGEVSVGNMGSDRIFQYTALGDNMNLASRLESLTKHYGANLMISEYTYASLGDKKQEFTFRPLDLVQVKGKSTAVKIYEVIPSWNPWAKNPDLLELYTDAYENDFLKRRFTEAITKFAKVLETIPEDKCTEKLKAEAEEFLKTPPPASWAGVTVFTTK